MINNEIPDGLDVRSVCAKPVSLQAVLVGEENLAQVVEWIESNGHHAVLGVDQLTIQALEGPFVVRYGDYVVRGSQGEFFRCDPDAYKESYSDQGAA